MAQGFESDLLDDVDVEGASDLLDDELEEGDEFDELEEDDYDGMEAFDEFEAFDELEEFDELEDEYEEFDSLEEDFRQDYSDDFMDDGMDELEDAVADALYADDTDEFFKKLFRGIKKVAKRVGKGVKRVAGRVGRVAAGPIGKIVGRVAGAIPLPFTQAIARGLPLLAKLKNLRADELEALDEFADEVADGLIEEDAAIPIVAGLAARSLLRGNAKRLTRQARKNTVRALSSAAKVLVKRKGPKAIRALPRIVRMVRKKVTSNGLPVRGAAKAVAKTAGKVSKSTNAIRRLARPLPKSHRRLTIKRTMGRVGLTNPLRSFVLRGPVRINITSS